MKILDGYKSYIAGFVMIVMTANAVFNFIPAQYVEAIWSGAAALGLVGIRSAIEKAIPAEKK